MTRKENHSARGVVFGLLTLFFIGGIVGGVWLLQSPSEPSGKEDRLEVAVRPIQESELSNVIDALGDADIERRHLAAYRLSRSGEVALDRVTERLGDSDSEVRRWAAISLGLMGDGAERAAPALAKQLNDENDAARVAAVFALTRIGASAEQGAALLDAIEQGNVMRPQSAAFVISHRSVPGGELCEYIRVAGGDIQIEMRRNARNSDPNLTLRLINDTAAFLEHEVEDSVNNAQLACGPSSVPRLIELLDSSEEWLRRFAITTLGNMVGGSLSQLSQALSDTRNNVRIGAALALGLVGPVAQSEVTQLIAALERERARDKDHCLPCAAIVKALDSIEGEQSRALLKVVRGENPLASLYAADALRSAGLKAPDQLESLATSLTDSRAHVRRAAAYVVGELDEKSTENIQTLKASLKSDDVSEVIVAATTLENLETGEGGGLSALVPLLEDSDPSVRISAAESIGSIGPNAKSALDALVATMDDSDSDLRLAAIKAIRKIGVAQNNVLTALVRELSRPPGRNQNLAALALGSLGPAAIPYAVQSLIHEDSSTRRWAAFALGHIKPDDGRVMRALVGALNDDVASVAVEAAKALEQLGRRHRTSGGVVTEVLGTVAVPVLVGRFRAEAAPLRKAAAEAIGAIGHSDADTIQALEGLLDDEVVLVRGAAVVGLMELEQRSSDYRPILEAVLEAPDALSSDRLVAERLWRDLRKEGF